MAKIPTQWFTSNRNGTVTIIGNLFFADNLGNIIVDNTASHKNLVTTPLRISKQPATAWVQN